jgi:hypothetical protein
MYLMYPNNSWLSSVLGVQLSAKEGCSMNDAENGAKPKTESNTSSHQRWARLVGYAKHKYHERRAKKKKETAEERAIRLNMWSTAIIAIFTVVLAVVSYFQLKELHQSGVDSSDQMNRMIEKNREQVAQIGRQADETSKLAEHMGDQAERTKELARQTRDLAVSTQQMADTSRDELQTVQRAYITFQGVTEQPVISLQDVGSTFHFEFNVEMLNVGNTPANSMVRFFDIQEVPLGPNEQQFIGSELSTTHIAIGPKAPSQFGRLERPDSFLGLRFDAQRGFTRHGAWPMVYTWGWMAYKDVFPHTALHLTEFCQRLNDVGFNPSTTTGIAPTLHLKFDDCKSHNCEDEQCEDYKQIYEVVAKTLKPN